MQRNNIISHFFQLIWEYFTQKEACCPRGRSRREPKNKQISTLRTLQFGQTYFTIEINHVRVQRLGFGKIFGMKRSTALGTEQCPKNRKNSAKTTRNFSLHSRGPHQDFKTPDLGATINRIFGNFLNNPISFSKLPKTPGDMVLVDLTMLQVTLWIGTFIALSSEQLSRKK